MKNWLIWKDPDTGKDWRQEEKRKTEDEMVGWHHQHYDMSLSRLWELVMEGKPGVLRSMGSQRFGQDLATALNWTNTWKDAQHCSLLEKCKSKLQWDITSHWSEWPLSKSLQTINGGEGGEKREPSCMVGWNVNWYSHYGRRYADSLKTRNKTIMV